MIRLEMKNYSMPLIEKQPKYLPFSSGKIHKYEYLTGEDTSPSNQQQIIEQTRFTYSPLRKDFDKQIKTIEDQGQKQTDALIDLKSKEQAKAIPYQSDDDNTSISKETYDEILEERMEEILKMSKEINYGKLVYDFKGPTPSINLVIFGGPMYTYNQLKDGEKRLQQVEEEQKYFKKYLKEITSGNSKHESEKQLYTIKNIRNIYDSRQKIINLLNDNAKNRSEVI